MSRSKNRAAIVFALVAFVLTMAGCSGMREPAREAGSGFVSGAREEAELWWSEKRPMIVAAAKEAGTEIAERVGERLEKEIAKQGADAEKKQEEGKDLTPWQQFMLGLAAAMPMIVALGKAGLRYARGVGDLPPAPPAAAPPR